ncbi:MAG TPA: UDP-glucuronic acid decarboxylase family protein [Terriglobales bacterium]|nr:UDP-glucuronic acid decarboxylase family protein [Terriglobales bacterium]
MRIAMAGGAGFLGSHFCDRLLAEGHEVVCLDNLVTGSRANIEHLAGQARFHFELQDVCEPFTVPGPVDVVCNFASPASPVDFARLSLDIMRVGSVGTWNCLELARAKGAGFLITCTSEAYGDPLVHPQREDYWGNVNPVGPRSCYDESKRFAEALTMAYHRKYGLATRIARIFNTYGPRMRLDDGRVVPALIAQALQGEPLTVFGDGSQTRSFCYVDDQVEGLRRLMDCPDPYPVNIGNPQETSILEFARVVAALAGVPGRLEFRPLPQDDPRRRCPDIARARQLLGWEPRIGLEEGLRRTLQSFAPRLA